MAANFSNEILSFDEYREIWQKTVKVNLGQTDSIKNGSCILMGNITRVSVNLNHQEEELAFATLEDFNGKIDVTFFPKTWKKYHAVVEEGKIIILRGWIEKTPQKLIFIAQKVVSVQKHLKTKSA